MRKSAKYFLNNNGKYAQVNSGDIYGTVYGVRNDADASGGTIKMNEGAAFNLYGGLSFNKNEAMLRVILSA